MAIWYPGEMASLLLDSRLITPVRFKKYSFKIVRCGDYLQVYYYNKPREIKDVEKLDIDNLKKKSRSVSSIPGKIEERNVIRTKLNCQRLAKANAKEWKSFITLTYKECMQDVKQAKKDLEYYVSNIKKVKKDFKYIAIPEFQTRGAIHFHLLTNLEHDSEFIPKRPKIRVYNKKKKIYREIEYYNLKYWNKGFSDSEKVDGDIKKVVGYISKYMTEDCDERLFNFRRFSSSQNLEKPVTEFISMRDDHSRQWLIKQLEGKDLIYSNQYNDVFNNSVEFKEFLSVNIIGHDAK